MNLYKSIIVRLKEVMRYFNNIKFNKANPSVNFFYLHFYHFSLGIFQSITLSRINTVLLYVFFLLQIKNTFLHVNKRNQFSEI